MATDGKSRPNKQSTITFTLPMSCQICLGKVKQPVLCPNHHVFCQLCMDIWLEKNKQCPTCRVDINEENPVRSVIGGQLEDEDKSRQSSAEIRRARFELLYREYEDEFEKMKKELIILRTENNILAAQLKDAEDENEHHKKTEDNQQKEGPNLLLLTQNLQEAQKLYTGIKDEMANLKQENAKLKDENINLTRENETLRMEIAQRSPKKFGRYTVATLETKISELEKENRQLTNALQRSDTYIDDLEKQISKMSSETEINHVDQDFKKPGDAIKTSGKLPGKVKYNPGTEKLDSGRTEYHCTDSSSVKRSLFSHPGSSLPKEIQALDEVVKDKGIKLNTPDFNEEGLLIEKSNKLAVTSHKLPESIMKTSTESFVSKTGIERNNNDHIYTSERKSKKVKFDMHVEENASTSFDLEMPSPYNGMANTESHGDEKIQSSGKSLNEKSNSAILNSESNLRKSASPKPSSAFDEYITNLLQKSNLTSSKIILPDSDPIISQSKNDTKMSSAYSSKSHSLRLHDSEDSSHLSIPDLNSPDKRASESFNGLNSKFKKTMENGDLNVSMTPELSDCLKLMAQAERKLEQSNVDENNVVEFSSLRSAQENFSQLSLSKHHAHSSSSLPSSLYMSMKTKPSAPLQSFAPSTDVSWKQHFFSSLSANPYKFNPSLGSAVKSQALSSVGNSIPEQSKTIHSNGSNWSSTLGGKNKELFPVENLNNTVAHKSKDSLHILNPNFHLSSQSNLDLFHPSHSAGMLTNNVGDGAFSMSSSSHSPHAGLSKSLPSRDHNLFSFPSADIHQPVQQVPPSLPPPSSSSLSPHPSYIKPTSTNGLPATSSVHTHIESDPTTSYQSSSHVFKNPLPPSLNNSALEWPDDSFSELSVPSSNGLGLKSSSSLATVNSDSLPVPSEGRANLGHAAFVPRNGKHSNYANSSYISSSLVSDDNSFQLPEPKKRLFNISDDDLELPSSPLKSSKR